MVEPSDPHAARVFSEVRTWLAEDTEIRKDRERLVKVCCAPQSPVLIQSAPKPASLSA